MLTKSEPLRPKGRRFLRSADLCSFGLMRRFGGLTTSPIPTDSLSVGLLNLIYNLNIHREHPLTFDSFNKYLNFSIPALKSEAFSCKLYLSFN